MHAVNADPVPQTNRSVYAVNAGDNIVTWVEGNNVSNGFAGLGIAVDNRTL